MIFESISDRYILNNDGLISLDSLDTYGSSQSEVLVPIPKLSP